MNGDLCEILDEAGCVCARERTNDEKRFLFYVFSCEVQKFQSHEVWCVADFVARSTVAPVGIVQITRSLKKSQLDAESLVDDDTNTQRPPSLNFFDIESLAHKNLLFKRENIVINVMNRWGLWSGGRMIIDCGLTIDRQFILTVSSRVSMNRLQVFFSKEKISLKSRRVSTQPSLVLRLEFHVFFVSFFFAFSSHSNASFEVVCELRISLPPQHYSRSLQRGSFDWGFERLQPSTTSAGRLSKSTRPMIIEGEKKKISFRKL